MVCLQAWKKIGIYEIKLTKIIINDNVKKEMSKSEVDPETGRYLMKLTMDGGWNHQGSGILYNLDSCQHIAYGAETKKIVALKTISRACNKCHFKTKHINFFLPKISKTPRNLWRPMVLLLMSIGFTVGSIASSTQS